MNAVTTVRRPMTESDLTNNPLPQPAEDWIQEIVDGKETGYMVGVELQQGMQSTVQIGVCYGNSWAPNADVYLLTASGCGDGRQYTAVCRRSTGEMVILFNVTERFVHSGEKWPEGVGRLTCMRFLRVSQLREYLAPEDVNNINTLLARHRSAIIKLHPFVELMRA